MSQDLRWGLDICGILLESRTLYSMEACVQNPQPQISYIIEVDYNAQGTRIAKVKILFFVNGKYQPAIKTRQQVVSLIINDKLVIYTAVATSQNKYQPGAEVMAYPINGEWFIKTEPNDTPDDNLGELPPIS